MWQQQIPVTMQRRRMWDRSPVLIVALGGVLFLAAVAHHVREMLVLGRLIGPVTALLLDGALALALVYGGYRLSGTDFVPEDRWAVTVWALGGCLVFLVVMGATLLVRMVEGRIITEPQFPLLIAVEAGALAGLVAGYYNARARADARRVRSVSDALAFVNNLLRHDLRNDLNVIQVRADLIEDRQASGDAGTDDQSAVISEKAGEALARIETSRAITDTLVGDSDLEPVDIAAVVEEVAAQVETTFDVAVTVDIPDRALVTANAGLRSVVDNLLENAAEHNDADDPRIDVAVETDADTVEVTVRDNGPGIPDERKDSLFDDRATGTGGGLSLAGTLVERYGGDIRVEDNEPRGTSFVVELRRADGPSE